MSTSTRESYLQISESPVGVEVANPAASQPTNTLIKHGTAFLAGATISAVAIMGVPESASTPEGQNNPGHYSSSEVDDTARDLASVILSNIPTDTKCESSCLAGTMNTSKEPLNGRTWKFEAHILGQGVLEVLATQAENQPAGRVTHLGSSKGVSVYFDVDNVVMSDKEPYNINLIKKLVDNPATTPAFINISDGDQYTSVLSQRMSDAADKKATIELGETGNKNVQTLSQGTKEFDSALSQAFGDALLTLGSVKQTAANNPAY